MKPGEVYSPNRSALGAKITTTPTFGKGGERDRCQLCCPIALEQTRYIFLRYSHSSCRAWRGCHCWLVQQCAFGTHRTHPAVWAPSRKEKIF
jgi:hypothetical protein